MQLAQMESCKKIGRVELLWMALAEAFTLIGQTLRR